MNNLTEGQIAIIVAALMLISFAGGYLVCTFLADPPSPARRPVSGDSVDRFEYNAEENAIRYMGAEGYWCYQAKRAFNRAYEDMPLLDSTADETPPKAYLRVLAADAAVARYCGEMYR